MLRFILNIDTWQEAVNSIGKNKFRTIITVTGVFWGILVYITLSGASKGLDNGFEQRFERVSPNSFFTWTQGTSIPYKGFKSGRSFSLKLEDVNFLKSRVKEIKYISPAINRGVFGNGTTIIKRGSESESYGVYGHFPKILNISDKEIYDGGRFFNQLDIDNERKVCLIGERIVNDFFEEWEEPIGNNITIDGEFFTVIGIMKFVAGGGIEKDSDIWIPFTTFQNLYNTGERIGWLSMSAHDEYDVKRVEEKVKSLIKYKYDVHPDDKSAVNGFNIGEIFDRIKKFAKGLTLLSIVVGIATVFGGVIGIGNILLISVRERTKEIGIRRALGAKPVEIRLQIIIESVTLTLLSGVSGIVVGSFVLYTIDFFTKNMSDFPYTNPTVPISNIVGVLIFMVVLGSVIGLIPAQRAVSIKPIDALRED